MFTLGSYEIDVKLGGEISKGWASIKKPSKDSSEVMEIIVTYKSNDEYVYKLWDRINVNNVRSEFVQIFEVSLLGKHVLFRL